MRKLFLALLILGIVLILGLGVFVFYYYPHFVQPRINYEDAVALFEKGDYVSSAMKFESMSSYSNSAEYAKRAWLEAGNKSFDEGNYALAKTYYTKAQADEAVFRQIDYAYFEQGKAAYEAGDNLQGESCFMCIGDDSDYVSQMDVVRMSFAKGLMDNDDYAGAESVFAVCSPDNYDNISSLWMDCGKNKLHIWDVLNADTCFAKAVNYSSDKDAVQLEVNQLWVEAGKLAEADENYTLADKCYARGNYSYDREDILNSAAYNEAMELYEQGSLFEALAKFTEVADYGDAADKIAEITDVLSHWFVAGGAVFYATLDQNGHVDTHGDWEIYSAPDWPRVEKLSVGYYRFMLGIKSDGTVVANGNDSWHNLEVDDWTDIIETACGDMHSVGLKSDGTVVACGRDYYGQVSHAMEWTDIIQIDAGVSLTVGLKSDGTVVAEGENSHGECETGFMTDVTQISCGASHVVALKSDGTVVACGLNDDGQCNVESWTDIVAIYAGAYHTVGLKSDGTLVACGANSYGECNVRDYRDPICVSCGRGFTLMILKDGTIVKLGAINNVEQ